MMATVDTGVYWTHPDINSNMWEDIGEDMYNYDGNPAVRYCHISPVPARRTATISQPPPTQTVIACLLNLMTLWLRSQPSGVSPRPAAALTVRDRGECDNHGVGVKFITLMPI